ncbi:DinB family protein [Chitinophaga pinensis]|uniref:DinB family protein n=1 Tax=Chitinophaga pinensis (strain ATCC 43595 / DSM 2588 / LMG 13176 / NBRC 15968 / NCIMB 11800 / UQM 2034) TaxID=485918 RepID=A0A979G2X6_CHIPD|nr:DinB family protein [Chitinophaga pinensis]ACU59701.1 DinB family protein [Chitinophaga pinensis DSM 2588]
MYHSITAFLEDWDFEVHKTLNVFSLLTKDTSSVKVHSNIRTLDRLALHISQVISDIGMQVGLFEQDDLAVQGTTTDLSQLIDIYKDYHQRMRSVVQTHWQDNILDGDVTLFGKSWKRGDVLSLLVQHEIHHRSQMSVIMRILDLPVPELYGPVREDWIKMGLPIAE